MQVGPLEGVMLWGGVVNNPIVAGFLSMKLEDVLKEEANGQR